MKRSRFTKVQVAYDRREAGTPVMEVCRSLGISEATFYIWKKKYSDLGTNEVRRLRSLRKRMPGRSACWLI
ncbi:putative transposase [Nitrosospira sp. Nl5]|uniref:transposase n=1 Tax=Nitrosospira sp. Nl5 TaxID=200120 RepID=UPI0008843779|nr:putative transposase [Nitrosospira sp. Nl5]